MQQPVSLPGIAGDDTKQVMSSACRQLRAARMWWPQPPSPGIRPEPTMPAGKQQLNDLRLLLQPFVCACLLLP